MKKLSLGERMKEFYESRTRIALPRRTYCLIRIDGKKFSSYTRGLVKPFDEGFIDDMNKTALHLCENIQGARMAFVQSDEISVLFTDFEEYDSQAWFDNDIQKVASISASYATAEFNKLRLKRILEANGDALKMRWANFDSRIWTIPEREEVINYIIWRQRDCTKNSISSAAQTYFSHSRLDGVNGDQKQELLFTEKGINWNDYPIGQKRGRVIRKENVEVKDGVVRNKWIIDNEIPIFSKEREYMYNLVPKYEYEKDNDEKISE